MTTPTREEALADLDSGTVAAWMTEQIRADAAASRFARWGRCTVEHDGAGEPVLTRELFDELHELAGVDASWPVGNAGLLHVYGYLLSRAETPHGRKRDRWTAGGVARAFGLPADAFAPWFVTPSASGSTPLERITAVAEPFAVEPADGDFTVLWIDETGTAHDPIGGPGETVLARTAVASPVLARTVVVRDEDSGATALLYAVGASSEPLLVTLFPLEDFGPDWLERATVGSPRLRYNAVDGRNAASAPLAERTVTLRDF
jgi:hypothetical protein